ncbi:ABC transporter ATP-binding protein [Rhizobiaceae bacterium]|nr:ABC transporter ATP-binding protein [Rhizobiaceae bacterium]
MLNDVWIFAMTAAAHTAPALSIRGLRKTFDEPAVDNLDLTVERGTFYALLGPNGAGKTTTLRIVAGLMDADAGQVHVLGHDLAVDPLAAKAHTAWVPDEAMIYDRLTPYEYLEFVCGLWGVAPSDGEARARRLVGWLGLDEVSGRRCGGFSKGQRQKVALAGALVHDPDLIILDEPLTGLDAGSSRQVKDVLKHRVANGATVIMTTHILEVAERMAERIGVIAQGRLVAEGTLAELQARRPNGGTLEEVFLDIVAADPTRIAA